MTYEVILHEKDAQPYYEDQDPKSRKIIRDNLKKLEEDPYPRPGSGAGDTEKIVYQGKEAYRMHIGRSHTAIYTVDEEKDLVLVHELLDIGDAHKRYGF
ncbi:MAG: type II toxin-antitoxin system RelE family toxin [Candidatus Aenigmatarchaeota archaeon]